MESKTNMQLGRFGESDRQVTVLISGLSGPPAAQIILGAGYSSKAVSVTLDADEMAIVLEALASKEGHCRIPAEQTVFRVSPENRGEPYRDGFALSLDEVENYENTSCWLDERDAESLAQMLGERLRAEPDEALSP